MKPGYLYMIVGNESRHFFEVGDLVVSRRMDPVFARACLCDGETGKSWWVLSKDVVEIGEI